MPHDVSLIATIAAGIKLENRIARVLFVLEGQTMVLLPGMFPDPGHRRRIRQQP
jgi:hypothetical protein